MIDREIAQLVSTYKMLHAAPELSHYEVKTSAFFAAQLRALGYEVTENVGKFGQPNWKGYGVVAVMKNGAGPTVLFWCDWQQTGALFERLRAEARDCEVRRARFAPGGADVRSL